MNRKVFIALIVVVVAQLGVLFGVLGGAMYPLMTGTEVKLKVVPVDPRSLFRGNYARLTYDISTISVPTAKEDREVRYNEVVYVKLKKIAGSDIYEYDTASFDKPAEGIFLRGRVTWRDWDAGKTHFSARYGIEAYFAAKDRAIELERNLASGGIAVVMVASNGKATLKDVIPDSNPAR